jgi:acetylglutamate kinase
VRILAKIGGAQLEVPERRAQMALAVRRAIDAGHEVVVVHGGGNQIRELGKRLGIPERQHQGLRVTDAETADVVLMVLAGLVNKVLVHDLCAAGVRAVGYAGADAQSFHVAKHEPAGTDIGYVGTIAKVDPALTFALLEQGFTPTIATSAPLAAGAAGPHDHSYNVNADLAAGPLAAAFRCDALLFLTDVPGVLDAAKTRCASLTRARCAELKASGVVSGGRIPTVDAALAALDAHPRGIVKIAPADGDDCVLRALADDVGTRFLAS